MADSTDKSYGIFLNSNQSSYLSTEKSYVNIPFNGNLSDHNPNKTLQISLTSMLFTNTIYNITTENNQMNILIYYNEGRGRPRTLQEKKVEIPPGFYNITQLSDYLSKSGIMGDEIIQFLFRYGTIETYCNLFTGFGAVPADPNDPILTKAAPTNDSNTKIVFQSSDLGHMIQFGTDIATEPDNWGQYVYNDPNSVQHSYLYQGIFVECPTGNSILPQLLKMLGYFNINSAPAPFIDIEVPDPDNPGAFLPRRQGYGLYFDMKESNNGGPPYDNTVYFTPKDYTKLNLNPTNLPKNFHGVVYQSGVVLTCAFETNVVATAAYGVNVIELDNGSFINGTGISIPAPYVVNYQDCRFYAQFTAASNIMTVTSTVSGVLQVGMSIGVDYSTTTKTFTSNEAFNLSDTYFDYRTGTTLGPGLENNHCFYITAIGSAPDTYELNQDFPVDLTIDPVPYTGNTWYPACLLGTVYVLTSTQTAMIGGITEAMLSSPVSVTDVAGRITPNNVTNLAGVDEIHIHCPQLRTQNFSSTQFYPLAPSDVIAVVPVEVEFGFKQAYQPPNPLTCYLINTNITNLQISLTNARNQPLNFNGVDWSMTFFCSEVDTMSYDQLLQQGTLNTPFQDQLATMEGTAHGEERKKRQVNRVITFYENAQRSSRQRMLTGGRY